MFVMIIFFSIILTINISKENPWAAVLTVQHGIRNSFRSKL